MMFDTNESSFALDPLADLTGAALRLLAPLALAGGLGLVVLLGAVAANPAALAPRVAPQAPASSAPVVNLPPGAGGLALAIAAVRMARAQIGRPYVWGAAGPDAFDCSGLVQWAWAQVGVSIPKFTVDQYAALKPVPLAQAQPGDLVFLQNTYPADYAITHVAMVSERGTVIEAPAPGLAVREVPFGRYTATHFFGVARPRTGRG